MFPIRTILHPTDFSERSELALHLASSLARDRGARLILLHVVPSYEAAISDIRGSPVKPYEDYGEELKRYEEEMRTKLRRVRVPDPEVEVEPILKEGDVAKVVLRVANETPCDLIVMGTHGRTGQERLLMGSVAEVVSRKAPCPVLTVRVPAGFAPACMEPTLAAAGAS